MPHRQHIVAIKAPYLRSFVFTALAIVLHTGFLHADVRMPGIFGDHMVLQQNMKLPVWGTAVPGEAVTVAFAGMTGRATAGADGRWRIDLPPVPAGATPQILTVTGKNTLIFQDVLVGDVWICSGQSNMEFGTTGDTRGPEEVAKADYPQIRIFWVIKDASLTPLEDFGDMSPERPWLGTWQVCTPDVVKKDGSWNGFSGVGFYFARDIYQITGQPVGIIGSYWGGTPAQSWTSLPALQENPGLSYYADAVKSLTPEQRRLFPANWVTYDVAGRKWNSEIGDAYKKEVLNPWREAAQEAKAAGLPPPAPPAPPKSPAPRNPGNISTPATLFNGMINPLIPYAIKGVIWYQGESNEGAAAEYGTLFPVMIADWRKRWNQGDFPFLFVQLAGFQSKGAWPVLRESQAKALNLPNTGMATAIDIGDPKNIHPRDKFDVGARLALAAQHVAYGKNLVYAGPTFDSVKVDGGKISIAWRNTGSGLIMGTPPWTPTGVPPVLPAVLNGFEIAGADQKWVPANAVINGETVTVSSAQVAAPVAVRYDWADAPSGNLYNKEGLPAFPFRTESWK